MAKNEGERKMLFDIRGRRKNVVKVVYAILALLMGLSLFILAGPIGGIFNTGNSASEAAEQFEDQAATIERKLKKDPENPDLLLALTRQRINAGNTLSTINPETGVPELTIEARQQYEQASNSWSEYLKATDEPSPSVAQLTAPMFFNLAESSSTVGEAEANVAAAAAAEKIIAEARPTLNSLSTLAIYTYFTFDYAAAEKAGKEAQKFASSKFERENLENQLEETKKAAEETEKRFAEFKKATKGQGKEALQSPLGGLSGEGTLSP
jgi:biopolymer transport protein ExbB/TolQ